MEKIFAQYVQLQLILEEMLGKGEMPGEEMLRQIREFETYIRNQGYDPDVVFMNYKNQKNSNVPSGISTGAGAQKIISRIIQLIKPVMPSDAGFLERAEEFVQDENGMSYKTIEAAYMCANGHFMKKEELAGRCMYVENGRDCGRYVCVKHFVCCYEPTCGIGTCNLHAFPLEIEPRLQVKFCPSCYEIRVRKFNTWEFARKAILQARRLALPKFREEDEP